MRPIGMRLRIKPMGKSPGAGASGGIGHPCLPDIPSPHVPLLAAPPPRVVTRAVAGRPGARAYRRRLARLLCATPLGDGLIARALVLGIAVTVIGLPAPMVGGRTGWRVPSGKSRKNLVGVSRGRGVSAANGEVHR